MIRKVCVDCGSGDVCKDADVIWNEHTQAWELDPDCDIEGNPPYCRDCGEETELKDVKL